MSKIKKVWIDPGCISCGACEFLAPELFEVTDKSRVKKDVNTIENLNQLNDLIEQAAAACPVSVIKFEKES